MVPELVVGAVGTVELVEGVRHRLGDHGVGQRRPGGDGQVSGADEVPAVDGELGVVETGGVLEHGVVPQADVPRYPRHVLREALDRSVRPLGQGDGRVVGGGQHHGVEGVGEAPDLTGLHVDLAGGHGLGAGAGGNGGVGRQAVDHRERGEDLGEAGRGQGHPLVVGVEHHPGVHVDQDPGPGQGCGRPGRGHRRAR